jgi:Leucine Rich Repeat (LRR) protein
MADIVTPPNARKTEEFSQTQVDLVRNSLGIGDFPYQPDKTYIIFDADSGNNDLHIDVGGSSTYSILKGDGGLSGGVATSYTDIGGLKTLNYTNAGRYLITIEGTFNGLFVDGASAAKRKYIEIIGGTNYPVAIRANAFESCSLLETAIFKFATSIGDSAFSGCTLLTNINFPLITSIGEFACNNCDSLVNINFPEVTSTNNGSFDSCDLLVNTNFPKVTSIGDGTFNSCDSLVNINFPEVTSIGASTFNNCIGLIVVIMKYTSGLTIGAGAFNNVKLSDLYPIGATNGTEAASVETKLTTAGMTQLNAYRLLY